MTQQEYDAVIVGAGHNGLVTATWLARSGLRVLLLEARSEVGGMAGWHEIHPGFQAPSLAHLVPGLNARTIRALDLDGAGLEKDLQRVSTISLRDDGDDLHIDPDPAAAAHAIGAHSAADGAAWRDFHARMQRHVEALRPLIENTPPRLDFSERGNLMQLARLGWSVRRQGRASMRELLRIISMNMADLIDENFEADAVRGMLALDSVLGTDHGPRSPNTVFSWLLRQTLFNGAPMLSAGGSQRLVKALEVAARNAGVDIRTDARVARIDVAGGSARGVELADGTRYQADAVVANTDPVTTLVDLVDADHLDADFLGDVRAFRNRATTGKVNLALDRAPDLPLPEGGGAARWVIAPSLDAVEQAFDQVKYREDVNAPALEITVPSFTDTGLAPDGQHVMSVNVAYVPYREDAAQDLGERVVRQIEAHAPGFAESVVACEAWGPADIEARFGARGGHWHHGDIALDQYFLTRPVPGFNQYRTPVDGLYLCGAGTHPGGGVTGISGSNAAREILQDRKSRRKVA